MGGKVGGSGRRGRERELVSIYEIKKDHFKEKKIKENKRKCPPQTCPLVNPMEAIPELRFSLPR